MAEQQVRVVIKDILHLHLSKTDHVLYARKRDGDMGIPQLAKAVFILAWCHGGILRCDNVPSFIKAMTTLRSGIFARLSYAFLSHFAM
jgi:hypothetical protein